MNCAERYGIAIHVSIDIIVTLYDIAIEPIRAIRSIPFLPCKQMDSPCIVNG